MAYCWVDGHVERWKDGQRVFGPAPQPADRPDSIWFGNLAIAGAGPWNAFTLHRVWVRGDQVTGIDHIVSDEFESTSIGLSKIAARR